MPSSTFEFCKNCVVSYKCCAQLGTQQGLTAPIVTEKEIKYIFSQYSIEGIYCKESFLEVSSDNKFVFKTRECGGCIFYEKEKCKIYNLRPFDCMIFPLDIYKIGLRYFWIIYDTYCKQNINKDIHELLKFGEMLLEKQGADFIYEFAQDINNAPNNIEYKILKEIVY